MAAEGWVTEAQTKAGACQIVQQRRRGYTRNILAVEAEGLDDGIAQGLGIRLHGLPDDGLPALKSGKNKQKPTSWGFHDVGLSVDSMVGVTRLELATSRPPAVRATSCATPRQRLSL